MSRRRMSRWIPYPERTGLLAIGILVAFELLLSLPTLILGGFPEVPLSVGLLVGVPTLAAIYGYYRFSQYHPSAIPEYRDWLKTTPWTPALPLPLGPVLLRWTDLLMLVAIPALGAAHLFLYGAVESDSLLFEDNAGQIVPPAKLAAYYALVLAALMLVLYLVPVAVSLIRLGERRSGYLMLFLLLLAVRMTPDLVPALGALLLALPASQYGLRRTLHTFPWDEEFRRTHPPLPWFSLETMGRNPRHEQVGWPYAGLAPGPTDEETGVSGEDALWIAALGGWAFYTIASFLYGEGIFALWLLYALIVGVLILMRVIRYTGWCSSSVGLLTRLRTGRLLVPGYDRVYLTPLGAAVLAAALPYLLESIRFSPAAAAGFALALVTLTVLAGGPGLSSWRLTGQWRMFPPAGNQLFPAERGKAALSEPAATRFRTTKN